MKRVGEGFAYVSCDFADEKRAWLLRGRELSVDDVDEFDGREERRVAVREGVIERRQHMRYAVDAWAEVLVKDGTMLFRGRVLDVSVGGCYIETEARLRLAPGTPVEMVFRVNDSVFRCEATSRTVRTRGAGFLFERMDARMRRELEGLIFELGEGAG
jgi:c-di-GMP-binding flagellar brake protein YcgR